MFPEVALVVATPHVRVHQRTQLVQTVQVAALPHVPQLVLVLVKDLPKSHVVPAPPVASPVARLCVTVLAHILVAEIVNLHVIHVPAYA